ncbi:MAG: protease complex subunit PrcB family protein [Chloroflexota bacterium]
MTELSFQVEPWSPPGDATLEYESRTGHVRITVRVGERRTGGYAIKVTRVTRTGPRLIVACEVRSPGSDAIVTQVLTSPTQTVSIAESGVRGVREAVLLDQTGAELARISA